MKRTSRRSFLAAGAAVTAPIFIPSRVLGKDGAIAPSNQITLGVIGYGNRCKVVLDHFLTFKQIRCIDVSDVQARRLADAKARVDKQYENNDCRTHADFRELLAKEDVQAVLIATGNRWHGMASITAARAGKDIYSEKPICMTIEEGRALVDTCRRLGTIYQAGHQRRSVDSFRFMIDIIRRGMIGQLKEIIAQVWQGPSFKPAPKAPVPPGLDWDMWLGPTPWHDFTPPRFHNWQYFWDTAEGMLTDMGCHWSDIAQWGHNSDHTGPTDIEGEAVWDKSAMSETPITGEIRSTYADGVKLIMRQKGAFKERFIRFVGSEGWIQLDDDTNIITANPAALLKLRTAGGKGLDDTGDHIGNFLESIRTRQPTVCNPEVAFRAQSICMLGTICLRLGRKLKWNPKAEKFAGDDEANRMLGRAVRAPWRL